MKRYILLCFALLAFVQLRGDDGDIDGQADAANTSTGITTVRRVVDKKTFLVILKDNVELIRIPAWGQAFPLVEDALVQDGQLAVVLDGDFRLIYQRYSKENGVWEKQWETGFYKLGLSSRNDLVLVQLSDISHVTLTLVKEGNMEPRQAGVTKPYDVKRSYEFPSKAVVIKDGKPSQSE